MLRTVNADAHIGSAFDGDHSIFAGDILVYWVECERGIDQGATVFDLLRGIETARNRGEQGAQCHL